MVINAGAGCEQVNSEPEETPWRPPVSARDADPIIFSAT